MLIILTNVSRNSRMYMGITRNGLYEEVRCSLDCAAISRERGKSVLAIPSTTLLQLASQIRVEAYDTHTEQIRPVCADICNGILPLLKSVVGEEMKVPKATVKEARMPDSHEDYASYPIDPYGR